MAVTAYPVILVDSTNGSASDTACSGAGPSTALTGASASTDAGGTVVTLDGSPSLANVNTDGSHVIYLADTTAGRRRFAAINAKDDSAKTVTVEQAFFGSLTGKAWAIGGTRATLVGSVSWLLFDNNSAAGDAMPGWTVEMKSGHSESVGSATRDLWRAGDTTNGPITIRGASGAATKPIITFTVNNQGFRVRGNYQHLRDFELRNTNATKTASFAIGTTSNVIGTVLSGITITHATDKFWRGLDWATNNNAAVAMKIEHCEIANCAAHGIIFGSSDYRNLEVMYCVIRSNGTNGITCGQSAEMPRIHNCIIASNTGVGISFSKTGTSSHGAGPVVHHCTIVGNSSHGIDFSSCADDGLLGLNITNNILDSNSGTGINSGSITNVKLRVANVIVRGNAFYNNSTDISTNLDNFDVDSTFGTNPSFTNAGSNDWSIGTALKGKGYPQTANLDGSATRSYYDPGAAQRQEAGGGVIYIDD